MAVLVADLMTKRVPQCEQIEWSWWTQREQLQLRLQERKKARKTEKEREGA